MTNKQDWDRKDTRLGTLFITMWFLGLPLTFILMVVLLIYCMNYMEGIHILILILMPIIWFGICSAPLLVGWLLSLGRSMRKKADKKYDKSYHSHSPLSDYSYWNKEPDYDPDDKRWGL